MPPSCLDWKFLGTNSWSGWGARDRRGSPMGLSWKTVSLAQHTLHRACCLAMNPPHPLCEAILTWTGAFVKFPCAFLALMSSNVHRILHLSSAVQVPWQEHSSQTMQNFSQAGAFRIHTELMVIKHTLNLWLDHRQWPSFRKNRTWKRH